MTNDLNITQPGYRVSDRVTHLYSSGKRQRAGIRAFVLVTAALTVAGCQTNKGDTDASTALYTGSIGQSATIEASNLTPETALDEVQRWGKAYTADEKDKVAALNYSAALRAAGEKQQAVAIMRKASIYHPKDREVLAAYGKALADNGRFREALATIQRAQHRDNPDWRLLATEGGIMDSIGQHDAARTVYRQAMVLAPNEPQILNNLGMSYVLTGELDQAEEVLRDALSQPNATIRSRQNLALVLGLKGQFKEAERIATRDVSPTQAKANMALLRDMLNQSNTWQDIAAEG